MFLLCIVLDCGLFSICGVDCILWVVWSLVDLVGCILLGIDEVVVVLSFW